MVNNFPVNQTKLISPVPDDVVFVYLLFSQKNRGVKGSEQFMLLQNVEIVINSLKPSGYYMHHIL
jgi:hypothetical protein